ncbi:MAG: hypothetical protein ABS68_13570 [Niastella sp. SCN 39-18]|nr:shikimate kinase [Sphingobacteriales bacterium]ODT50716.1 MAG: hypothetical protein ABS68_13570 [Niastella sp. SCN 39-18]OJW07489.1 MAG: hypothetical protein BGO53_02970 [Sphingobacteriales bacterium 39-19]
MNKKIPFTGQSRFFLVGFMGAGKSYWGKEWAAQQHLSFIDLDKVIEEKEKKSVAQIFEQKGEGYFREIEAQMLRSMLMYDQCIISCGGGAPCYHNNMDWILENGTSIYLKAKPAELLENIKTDDTARPLIQDKNEAELIYYIEKLMKEREPFYEQATLILDISDLNAMSFEKIMNKKQHA